MAKKRVGIRNGALVSVSSGLLDTYNAKAAYSFRKLKSNYNGPSVRIRRDNDNQEIDIGFINGELDINSINIFCSGTNGFLTIWYDQSGNGYNAIQTTLTSQPKIYDSVTGISTINGKYSIKFNGNALTGTQYLTQSIPNFTTTGSFFSVSKVTNLTQNVIFGNYNDTSYGTCLGIVNGNVRIQNSTNGNVNYPNKFTTNFALETFIRDISNNWVWYEQSVSKGTKSLGGSMNLRAIGARHGASVRIWSDAHVCELLYFETDETSNRVDIESDINNYYTIY